MHEKIRTNNQGSYSQPVQFDLTNYTLKKQLEKNWKI